MAPGTVGSNSFQSSLKTPCRATAIALVTCQ